MGSVDCDQHCTSFDGDSCLDEPRFYGFRSGPKPDWKNRETIEGEAKASHLFQPRHIAGGYFNVNDDWYSSTNQASWTPRMVGTSE